MSRFLTSAGLSLALRCFLGTMILVSAIPKLMDIETNSVYVVYSYYLLPLQPVNIARYVGLAIPYAEFLIALGLIFGALTRLSAIAWLAMSMLYFAAKIDLILVQGRIVECGCFRGLIPKMLVTQSIWLDVAGMAFSLQIAMARRGRQLLSLWAALPEKYRTSWLWRI
jgi:hypothetical protein